MGRASNPVAGIGAMFTDPETLMASTERVQDVLPAYLLSLSIGGPTTWFLGGLVSPEEVYGVLITREIMVYAVVLGVPVLTVLSAFLLYLPLWARKGYGENTGLSGFDGTFRDTLIIAVTSGILPALFAGIPIIGLLSILYYGQMVFIGLQERHNVSMKEFLFPPLSQFPMTLGEGAAVAVGVLIAITALYVGVTLPSTAVLIPPDDLFIAWRIG